MTQTIIWTVAILTVLGLLLALIAHWNVDITSASQPAAAPTPESATVSELESELEAASWKAGVPAA